jgi:hypothetical protein
MSQRGETMSYFYTPVGTAVTFDYTPQGLHGKLLMNNSECCGPARNIDGIMVIRS